MKCTKCGNEIIEGNQFCSSCGAPVISQSEEQQSTMSKQSVQIPQPQPVINEQPINNSVNPKPQNNKKLFLIVGLVIGGLIIISGISYGIYYLLINNADTKVDEMAQDIGDNLIDTTYEEHITPEGYKRVGDSIVGFIDIPEDFVNFKEIGSTSTTMKQYSTITQDFIITLEKYKNMDFDKTVTNFNSLLTSKGSVMVTDSTVAGYEAKNMFQYYPSEKYTLNVWILNVSDGPNYIAIEYAGDQGELKDKIIDSFLLEK